MREWVIYVGIMAVVLAIFFRENGIIGALAGLLVSGPLYLAFGFVLAKFGYRRRSLKEMRTPRASASSGRSSGRSSTSSSSADEGASPTRNRPAPTSRTSTGINRKKARKRR